MKTYPVSVPLADPYRGENPRRLEQIREYSRVASLVTKYINDDMATRPDGSINIYVSAVIARELAEDYELVRRIVSKIDGGNNGVTIRKGGPL